MSQNNSEETKQKLLFAAKIEFLEKGFQKASLRNICKKAGVTTGALYFFFKDKEDLFSTLVSGVYETLTDIFHLHLNAEHEHLEYICRTFEVSKVKTFGAVTELFDFKEREGISDDFEAGQRLFDCIYKDYETSMLLLSKAAGTKYEFFHDELISISQKHIKEKCAFIAEVLKCRKAPDFVIHWLAHLIIDTYFGVFYHVREKEEALKHFPIIMKGVQSAWIETFKSLFEEDGICRI